MADTAAIRETIERYRATFDRGDLDGWLDTFAPDAWDEDPVGTPVRRDRESIGQILTGAHEGAKKVDVEAMVVKVVGNEAAVAFRVRIHRNDGTLLGFDVIDWMTFDDQARVKSVRAIFDPADVVPVDA